MEVFSGLNDSMIPFYEFKYSAISTNLRITVICDLLASPGRVTDVNTRHSCKINQV